MSLLKLWLESKEVLDVRSFHVHEAMSGPFEASIVAVSTNEDIDLEAVVGHEALFFLGGPSPRHRFWRGLVSHVQEVQAEKTLPGMPALSTYFLRIVPRLWRTTQRRGNRIFQHQSVPEIVGRIFDEHGVDHLAHLTESYPRQDYRVQYGESDFAFVSRLLEEAGIGYFFEPLWEENADFGEGEPGDYRSVLVLSDRPGTRVKRETIAYADNPNQGADFVSHLRLSHDTLPGRVTLRDYDFRKPDYALFGQATHSLPEEFLEQYRYEHGAFTTDQAGNRRAAVSLEGERRRKRNVTYTSNCFDLYPGVVFSVDNHPRKDLGPEHTLLILDAVLEGTVNGEWTLSGEAAFTDYPYRPPQRTPRPTIGGVQSAVVLGPENEEIYTDEHGRVKVQFHWDREGLKDEESSCWVRVSQGWAGAAFGMIALPRVGQEVIVTFWEGNPDQPLIVGRLYNVKNQPPFKLPDEKTKSSWRSSTYPGGEGHNEITFEDRKGQEQVYVQAERDMRQLIKHDRHTQVGEVDTTLVGTQSLVAMLPAGKKGKSTTFMEMFDKRINITSGMAMVLLDGDSVTITGLTVNIIGLAGVNIAGGKIKLNC
jgi:type VI secretion system secreted protein VgrG